MNDMQLIPVGGGCGSWLFWFVLIAAVVMLLIAVGGA
jgi:hypothetical protein